MPIIFDKCCGCIDLKSGSFIIGYLNLVGTLIMTVVTILVVAGGAVIMNDKEHEGAHEAGLAILVVSIIWLIFVLLGLVFAVVLLVGLHKDKPGHLKAYLIYSVIFLVIFIIQFIANCSTGNVTASSAIINVLNLLLGIYFLLVIRSMFYQMKDPSRGPAIYSTA